MQFEKQLLYDIQLTMGHHESLEKMSNYVYKDLFINFSRTVQDFFSLSCNLPKYSALEHTIPPKQRKKDKRKRDRKQIEKIHNKKVQ